VIDKRKWRANERPVIPQRSQGHLILLRENATFGLFPLRITTSCLLVFYSVSSFTDIICIVMHLHSYPRALHSRVRRSTPPPKLQSTLVYQNAYLHILNIAVIGRETHVFACAYLQFPGYGFLKPITALYSALIIKIHTCISLTK